MKPNSKQGDNEITRHEVKTYKLNKIEGENPDTPENPNPFTLPLRMPGWFPDGIELPWHQTQRLFPEEVIGRSINGIPIPFGVQFCEPPPAPGSSKRGAKDAKDSPRPAAQTDPHKWILGNRIYEPHRGETAQGMTPLMRLICDLAKRIRKYNASLYRLRRLHFWFKYRDYKHDKNCKFPPPNPYGDVKDLPDAGSCEFRKLAQDSEKDWVRVTNDINNFIESAMDNYQDGCQLMLADMVEVNGYVVSMRVIVVPGPVHPNEPGGSSSHVSISSAFSSS
jgi:hypothetical protein